MIYFITVNYNSAELISNLRDSIQTTATIPYQLIVVNNSPDCQSISDLARDSTLILESGQNVGFGTGCNLGIRWVYQQDPQGIVWLMNPDTLLNASPDHVPAFFDAHPEVSILGTIVYTPTGNIWFAGGQFAARTGAILEKDLLGDRPGDAYVPCDWVTGCSLLINLRNFDHCPGFDPYYMLYYEDFDFCRRYAQQGHTVAITAQLSVIHYPSSITNRDFYHKYKHSTYSYLLATQKYTNKMVFSLRFLRLIFHSILLLFVKPSVGVGKIEGMLSYLKQ